MENWSLKTVNVTTKPIAIEDAKTPLDKIDDGVLGVDMTHDELRQKIAYFFAPDAYLGNRIKSYGGFLNYSVLYVSNLFGSAVSGPDVILYGHDTYLFHFSLEQPASDTPFPSYVQLVEQNFVLVNGLPATREQIMQVLQDLNGVYVRATYWEPTVTTRCGQVSETGRKIVSTVFRRVRIMNRRLSVFQDIGNIVGNGAGRVRAVQGDRSVRRTVPVSRELRRVVVRRMCRRLLQDADGTVRGILRPVPMQRAFQHLRQNYRNMRGELFSKTKSVSFSWIYRIYRAFS